MNYWTGVPPLGWEWEGEEEGPPRPSPEHRAKTISKKNWADRLKELERPLYHGTSVEATYQIQRSGLEPRMEWGLGFKGIYAWSDIESALNWANSWFGSESDWASIDGGGAIIEIPPHALEEVYADWDAGNDPWKARHQPTAFWEAPKRKIYWSLSQAFVITNPIPASELKIYEGEKFAEMVEEWEEEVEGEGLSFRGPITQFSEFEGEEGPGWAAYYGY